MIEKTQDLVALAEKCGAEVGRLDGQMVWAKFHKQSSLEAFATGVVMRAAMKPHSELVSRLLAASNYIDTLGGNSQSYRIALSHLSDSQKKEGGWKSLTDREWVNIVNSDEVKNEGGDVHGAVCEAFKLIEAKLREKNCAPTAAAEAPAVNTSESYERMRRALTIIANWTLPETGEYWDNEKTRPVSFEYNYGSNGARDYMQNIAAQALLGSDGGKHD